MRKAVLILAIVFGLSTFVAVNGQPITTARNLTVVLYPFIPDYQTVQAELKSGFEAQHPDIALQFNDLSSNYYGAGKPNYIGSASANVYELDSVFLQEFVEKKKIRQWPADVLLPENQLLTNAVAGSKAYGIRYGAAHWVCGNFIFYKNTDSAFASIKRLVDLETIIGGWDHSPGRGLVADVKGKSTLGEFYLETAFDHYGNWQGAHAHLQSIDATLEHNIIRLVDLCDPGMCRNADYHSNDPGIYGRLFADQKARALLGYSERLHPALIESAHCQQNAGCLTDSDIDVVGFPSDDKGRHQMSWVDSYVLDSRCDQQCAADAAEFVKYMESDKVYKTILLHSSAAPAYLLPAKANLYQDPEVLREAHLYPKLKRLIETAEAPSDAGLNDELRSRGGQLDRELSCNPPQ